MGTVVSVVRRWERAIRLPTVCWRIGEGGRSGVFYPGMGVLSTLGTSGRTGAAHAATSMQKDSTMSSISRRTLRRGFVAVGTASLFPLLLCKPALAGEVQLAGLDSAPAHQRFIVKLRQDATRIESKVALANALTSAARALPVRAGRPGTLRHLRRLAVGADVVQVDTPLDRIEAQALMHRLAADRNVDYVEVDRRHTIAAVSDDTHFNLQWGLFDSYGINATQAWDNATGSGVVVAVLDTGIAQHSDLSASVLPGFDFIDDTAVSNDGDGRDGDASDPGDWVAANQCGGLHGPEESSWHGTHVAGTIAAVTNNGKGVAGVAPDARILPVRVLGQCGGYMSDIADAIVWAAGDEVQGVPENANPAEVINLSLSAGGGCSTTMQNAINRAVAKGSTLVIAAGNGNTNAANASPASCANVIAVAASDRDGKRSVWGRSQQSNHGPLVDLAGPGSFIISTLNSGSTQPREEDYAFRGGTSMAAPHVSGVVALIQQVSNPAWTPAQVESLIKATATPFPVAPDREIGAGIVNAAAAVAVAMGGTLPPDPEPEPVVELVNALPLTDLAASKGSNRYYSVQLPAGASNLLVSIAGGSGDADLYVRAGNRPTSSAYDCRPFRAGNGESCSIPAPAAGTYYVMLTGYRAYSGVSLKASWGLVPSQTYRAGEGMDILDNGTVESAINVSGRTANAPAATPVTVDISHSWRGDLKVELLAPGGRAYLLSNYEGGSADDIKQTFEVDLSKEALNGTWTLRVNDKASGDTGRLNGWSITF